MLAQERTIPSSTTPASQCLSLSRSLSVSTMSQDSSLASSNDSTTTLPLSPDLSPQRILSPRVSSSSSPSRSYQQFLQSSMDDADDPQLNRAMTVMIEELEHNDAMLHLLRNRITTARASVSRCQASITGQKRTLTEMEASDSQSIPSDMIPATVSCSTPPIRRTSSSSATTTTASSSTSVATTAIDQEYRILPDWQEPHRDEVTTEAYDA